MRPMKVCIIPERKNTTRNMAVISFHHEGLCFGFSRVAIRHLIIQGVGDCEAQGGSFAVDA